MGVGQRIKELREQRHISVAELARRSGLTSASVLHKIEKEDRTPRLQTLANISKALGVEPSVLTDKEVKFPTPKTKLTLSDLRYVLENISDIEPTDREYVMEYVTTRRKFNRRRGKLMESIDEDLKKVPSQEDLESEIAFDVLAEESDEPPEAG
jgi:transcriptional regulator with XRE-family HTH domain